MRRIHVIDSHTGGEPTRVVIAGGPDLGGGALDKRLERFQSHHDAFRRAVICEPRGSDVLVGALLCETSKPQCIAGMIFFNNVGYLGMCGHGTIGVAVTLGYLGRLAAGRCVFETPVGRIPIEYDGSNTVTLQNVPCYREAKNVAVHVKGIGTVTGDVAWGGNWFYLVNDHHESLDLAHAGRLTDVTQRIKAALRENNLTGPNEMEIDHIELCGPPADKGNHGRNFVLCPGDAYDRSPCGTGTCAKIACLAEDGLLMPGEIWRQEGILGSVFTASYRKEGNLMIPKISGQAYVTAEATLVIDDADPLAWGYQS